MCVCVCVCFTYTSMVYITYKSFDIYIISFTGTKEFNVPFYRIEVPNLQQGSKYHICVYEKNLHFEKCVVWTSSSQGKEREAPTYIRDENNPSMMKQVVSKDPPAAHDELEYECIILPSLICAADMTATRLLFQNTQKTPLTSCKYLYFTGKCLPYLFC